MDAVKRIIERIPTIKVEEERDELYRDLKNQFTNLGVNNLQLSKESVINFAVIIKQDAESENEHLQNTAMNALESILNLNMLEEDVESVFIQRLLKGTTKENVKSFAFNVFKSRILVLVQSGAFNPSKMFGDEESFPLIQQAIREIGSELHTDTSIKFLLSKVIPCMFGKNVNSAIRDRAIEVGLDLLNFVNISHVPVREQSGVLFLFGENYIKIVGELRAEEYPNWHKLWIFLVRFYDIKMHTILPFANKLLRIVEVAFRNNESLEQRLQAYECWEELINNWSLNMNHMCTPKQIKLLITPMKAKFSRIPIIIAKRFETFVFLLEKLQDKSTYCLKEFLEFCFGPFPDEADINDVERAKQGRSVADVCARSTTVFMAIIGHRHGDKPCLDNDEISLDKPVIHNGNFKEFSTIIMNSVIECTLLVNEWSTPDHDENVLRCLWNSIMYFINNSDNDVQKKFQTIVINFLKNVTNKLDEAEYMSLIGAVVTDILMSNTQILNQQLTETIYQLVLNIACRPKNDEKCPLNYENIKKFVINFLRLGNNKSEHMKLILNYFNNDSKWGNYEFMSDIWMEFDNTVNDLFMKWPIRHYQHFRDQNAFKTKWLKLYQEHYKLEESKLTLLQDIEKIFKENPLLNTNIIIIAELIYQSEKCHTKELVSKLVGLLEHLLTFPNIADDNLKILISMISDYFDQTNNIENNSDAINKIFKCIEHLITVHKDYSILPKFANFLKLIQKKHLSKIPKTLTKQLDNLLLTGNETVVSDVRKVIALLETKENGSENTTFSTPSTPRSLRLVNMASKKPKSSPKPTETTTNALKLFGKNLDTLSPLNVKGSQLSNTVSNRVGKMMANSIKDKKTTQNTQISVEDDKSSDYVKIDTEVNFQVNKLSEHQKEILKKRREDIPALYQDLSQSQSESLSCSNDKSEENTKNDVIIKEGTNKTETDNNVTSNDVKSVVKDSEPEKNNKTKKNVEENDTNMKTYGRRRSNVKNSELEIPKKEIEDENIPKNNVESSKDNKEEDTIESSQNENDEEIKVEKTETTDNQTTDDNSITNNSLTSNNDTPVKTGDNLNQSPNRGKRKYQRKTFEIRNKISLRTIRKKVIEDSPPPRRAYRKGEKKNKDKDNSSNGLEIEPPVLEDEISTTSDIPTSQGKEIPILEPQITSPNTKEQESLKMKISKNKVVNMNDSINKSNNDDSNSNNETQNELVNSTEKTKKIDKTQLTPVDEKQKKISPSKKSKALNTLILHYEQCIDYVARNIHSEKSHRRRRKSEGSIENNNDNSRKRRSLITPPITIRRKRKRNEDNDNNLESEDSQNSQDTVENTSTTEIPSPKRRGRKPTKMLKLENVQKNETKSTDNDDSKPIGRQRSKSLGNLDDEIKKIYRKRVKSVDEPMKFVFEVVSPEKKLTNEETSTKNTITTTESNNLSSNNEISENNDKVDESLTSESTSDNSFEQSPNKKRRNRRTELVRLYEDNNKIQLTSSSSQESQDIVESSQKISPRFSARRKTRTPDSPNSKRSIRLSSKIQTELSDENSINSDKNENNEISKSLSSSNENKDSLADTDTCGSNITIITPELQLETPKKPAQLTDSETEMCNASTATFRSDCLSSQRLSQSNLENLPSSPITCETPDRNLELLNNTSDLSPIVSDPKDDTINNADDDNDDRSIENIKDVTLTSLTGARASKLLQLVNNSTPTMIKKTLLSKYSSPSTSNRHIEKKDEKVDVLEFSRDLPSPLTVPGSSILKSKRNLAESRRIPKRKRVNFSDPAVTGKKLVIKDPDEFGTWRDSLMDEEDDTNSISFIMNKFAEKGIPGEELGRHLSTLDKEHLELYNKLLMDKTSQENFYGICEIMDLYLEREQNDENNVPLEDERRKKYLSRIVPLFIQKSDDADEVIEKCNEFKNKMKQSEDAYDKSNCDEGNKGEESLNVLLNKVRKRKTDDILLLMSSLVDEMKKRRAEFP